MIAIGRALAINSAVEDWPLTALLRPAKERLVIAGKGFDPKWLTFSRDGKRLYLSSYDVQPIRCLDVADGA